MNNPFYVQPQVMQGFQSGMGQLTSGLEKRKQRIAQEEEDQRISGLKEQAGQLFARGTPDEIAQFSIANPELGQMLIQQIGFRDESTKKNMIDTMRGTLAASSPEQVDMLFAERIQKVVDAGGDPSDTIAEFNRFHDDPEGFMTDLRMAYAGMDPEGYQAYSDQRPDASGKTTAEKSEPRTAQEKNLAKLADLRETDPTLAADFERLIGLKDQQKLSSLAEKQLDTAITRAIDAESSSRNAETLAQQFRELSSTGGVVTSVNQKLREWTGQEDAGVKMRNEYARLRNSYVVDNLPPGVASDKDIEMVKAGFPKDSASPEYIAEWLESVARVQRADSMLAEFKADYISREKSQVGMLKAWKEKIKETEGEKPADEGESDQPGMPEPLPGAKPGPGSVSVQQQEAPPEALQILAADPSPENIQYFMDIFGYVPEGY